MVTAEMPSHWYEDYERGRPGYPDRVSRCTSHAIRCQWRRLRLPGGADQRGQFDDRAIAMALDPIAGFQSVAGAAFPAISPPRS